MSEATESVQGSLSDISGIEVCVAFSLNDPCLNGSRVTAVESSQFQSRRPVGQSSSPSLLLALRSRLGEPCGAAGRFTYGSLSSVWITRISTRFRCARLFFLLLQSPPTQGHCIRAFVRVLARHFVPLPPCCCSMPTAPQILQGTARGWEPSLTSPALENLEHALRSTIASRRFLLSARHTHTAHEAFIVVEPNFLLTKLLNVAALYLPPALTLQLLSLPQPPPSGIPFLEYPWQPHTPISASCTKYWTRGTGVYQHHSEASLHLTFLLLSNSEGHIDVFL